MSRDPDLDDAVRTVLEERARELARAVVQEHVERASYVEFTTDRGRYAVGLSDVREVQPCGPVSRIPRAPASLVGITNIRGMLVPVFSLHDRAASATHGGWLIVLEGDGEPLAIVVDDVTRIIEADVDGLRSPPLGADGLGVVGITSNGAAVLDVPRLLASERFTTVSHGSSEGRP